MRDDADEPPALLQFKQGLERDVERLTVERAEALVDEHRIEAHAARARLHDIGEAERQCERGEEGLAGVMVEDLHVETALLIGALPLAGMELILAAAHDEQALVGHLHNIVQERVQHVRLE